MERISLHLSYKEATRTSTGYENTPNTDQLRNIISLANNVFEPLREKIGDQIIIDSLFRSPVVNKAVGGSVNSQHLCINGAAMDIKSYEGARYTNKDLFDKLLEMDFDQLIFECDEEKKDIPDWVHVSWVSRNLNRRQVYLSYKVKVKGNLVRKYLPYILTKV